MGIETAVYAGLALSAIGTATSVMGSISQANAAKKAAQANADLMEYNRQVMESDARAIEAQGSEEAKKVRQQARAHIATQRSLFAASGVEVNSDTPLSILADTAAGYKVEELETKRAYDLQAWQKRTQGSMYTAQGQIAVAEGSAAASNSMLRGASTLLSGGSNLALTYGGAKYHGMIKGF